MSSSPITAEQLAALPPEIRAVVQSMIEHYERRISALEAELAAARKTPQNSSLPPSTQHPHAKPPSAKPPSKRQRGGQPGHLKHERALIPTAECHEVFEHRPRHCRGCGSKLVGSDADPLRQARAGRRPMREEKGPARGSQTRNCRRSSRWWTNTGCIGSPASVV